MFAAGAMPSPNATHMQDEGNDFPYVPVIHSRRGTSQGRECMAEPEAAGSQGLWQARPQSR